MLTTSLSLLACSSMDDDLDAAAPNENSSNMREQLASNCNVLPGGNDPSVGLDTLSNDTLKIFPNDTIFHKLLMQCIASSQGMAKIVTRSIDGTVSGQGTNYWMSYYAPYLGVYSSANDSRSKQWNLEQDVTYNGRAWDFHLNILDLPEGVAPDNTEVRAVEAFYDYGFNNGIVTFSPTDFDAVRFPKKIFGPDIMGALTFAYDGSTTTNELYLTNIGSNNNVMYIRNVYLHTESSNGCIAIKAMIDFPALWFDTKGNSGFTATVIGAYDSATEGAVLYSGIVRNSSTEKSVKSLVLEHPSDEVLANYYPLWQNMMKDSEKNSSHEASNDNNETDSNQKSAENVGYEVGGNVGYYLKGKYVPASSVGDKMPYLKALNKCLDMVDDVFPISPYKNSVNQVEWMVLEKSR